MRILVIFALSFIIFPPLLNAQHSNEGKDEEAARVEITAKSDQESYRVIACGQTGALIFLKVLRVRMPKELNGIFHFTTKT